jgi:hypothetical protein
MKEKDEERLAKLTSISASNQIGDAGTKSLAGVMVQCAALAFINLFGN